jgi:hypothetical protein
MNLTLENIDYIYEDLLHKINFMDINHCYEVKISHSEHSIVIDFIHPNNIIVLKHNMGVPVFNVTLDLKNNTFNFGQPNGHQNTFNSTFLNPLNNKIYYSYVSPVINVFESISQININDFCEDDFIPSKLTALHYKIKHSKKSIEKRETSKIRFIMHTLFSDYIDADVRKLITYYRVPYDFIFDIKRVFNSILYDDYNKANYEKYIKRLFQTLAVYPALFRYLELGDPYRVISDIYNGVSLKHVLKEQYMTLRAVRTPIISRFNTDELNLIHMKKLRYIDLKFHYEIKNIIHKDYLKSNKAFVEYKKMFYERCNIKLKTKNPFKIREPIYEIQDSLRFLKNRCHINVDNSFKLDTLFEINKRFHEIAHRIFVPDNLEISSQAEISNIEESRMLNLDDFEFSDCVSQLTSPSDFIREGNDLKHCVAGYYHSFMEKKCVLFSIDDGNNRSTAELLLDFDIKNKNFKLLQHKSYKNISPVVKNQLIVKSLVSFLNKDISNFNQIKKSPVYKHARSMVLNKELVIENLLKPLKLYKKSSFYKKEDSK